MTGDFNRSIFIDSSKLDEIKKWNSTGIIDGVTTNQMIMLKDGIKPEDYEKVVKEICSEMAGKPVSVELTNSTATKEEMIEEAKRLNDLADNIVVKVPMIPEDSKSPEVIYELAKADIAVNVTTMMTFNQMVMASLATRHCKRPSFISIFYARSAEDHEKYRSGAKFEEEHPKVGPESQVDVHPNKIIEATAAFLKEGGYENPKIIVGSIRNASMVAEGFASGGHVLTITPDVLNAMLFSQRSIETIKDFDDAWVELQSQK